jgi:hypothetical protein
VLDTNQWERMPVLRHELAAALLFAVRSQDAFIVLPEVVKAEVRKHLVDKSRSAQERLKAASGELRQIFGTAQEVERRSDEDVGQALDDRIYQLQSVLTVVEHSGDDFRAAAQMVMAYRPPNQTGQQYRDSLMWQTILHLVEEDEVFLVTNDGGFYANKASDTLHPTLADEVSERGGEEVVLFRNVEALLSYWGSETVPQELIDQINDNVAEAVADAILEPVGEKGWAVWTCTSNSATFYLTENPDRFAVSSELEYELIDPEYPDAPEVPAIATVSATAAVDLDELDVNDVLLDELRIDAITPHGISKVADIKYARASGSIGTYSRRYRLRKEFGIESRRRK